MWLALGVLPGCTEQQGPVAETRDIGMIEKNMAMINGIGLIHSIKPVLHEVQINPSVWASTDYEYKKYAASILAQFCGWKSGESDWVELRDAMTGKLLGRYDAAGYEPGS